MKKILSFLSLPILLISGEESLHTEILNNEEMIQQLIGGLQTAERKISKLGKENLENLLVGEITYLNQQIASTYEQINTLVATLAQLKQEQEEYLKKSALQEASNTEALLAIKKELSVYAEKFNDQINEASKNVDSIHQLINALKQKNISDTTRLISKTVIDHEQIEVMQRKINRLIAEVTQIKTTQETQALEASIQPPIYHYRPDVNRSMGYAGIEFLWWTTYEDPLMCAISGQISGAPKTPSTMLQNNGSIGKAKSIEFDWKPGYRVMLGYCFQPYFWEIEALYTYFHDKGHLELFPPSNPSKTVIGIFPQDTASPPFKITSSICLNYNQADLLLARKFLCTDYLLFRLLFGATGAWVDQHWDYTYFGESLVTGKQNFKFYGAGMRVGLDTDWYLGKGFSFLTKVTGAILAGTFREFVFNFDNNAGITWAPNVDQNLSLKDHRFTYNAQLAFLPSWGKMFGRLGFLIYAGYELNLWFDLNQVYNDAYISPSNANGRIPIIEKGNIGFQGLTAGLKFSF